MQVNLKWSKQKMELELDPAVPTQVFKAKVAELTGVPPKKMKLMIKGSVVIDEPDWAAYSAKLKEGMTLMLMGTADPNFRPAAVAAGGGAAPPAAAAAAAAPAAAEPRLDDLLEQAAAAAAAEPADAAAVAEAAEAEAAAAAKVVAGDAEFGPPLCRVTVKHGTVEYVLHMRGLRGDGSEGTEGSASAAAAAASFEELLVSDVMQQLFAAGGTPPDQQKLVHQGAVLSAEIPLADPGLKFKQSAKDSVPEAKFMLMGNSRYHRAQAEGTFLVTAEQELVVLEADCAAVIQTASHRADPALVQVRVSRMMDVSGGMRSRLQSVHWKGDGMEDEAGRKVLLQRLSAVDVQLEAVRRQI